MTAFLYQVTRRETGDCYVGVSGKPRRRWAQHLRSARLGGGYRLHKALSKHGSEAFDFQVVAELPTPEEAKIAERILIALQQPKYNLTAGGDGTWGLSRPDVSVRMKARKGVTLSDEHKDSLKKARNARVCKPCAESTKEKISSANRGKVRSDETIAKLSLAKVGNRNAAGSVRSAETRAKISETKRRQAAQKKLTAQQSVQGEVQ